MITKKIQGNNLIKTFWTILALIFTWSFWGVLSIETSLLLKAILLFLVAIAIILSIYKSYDFLITLSIFIVTVQMYNILDKYSGNVSIFINFAFLFIALMLFTLTQRNEKGFADQSVRRKYVYIGLLALIMIEFFIALKFFPIDYKNRAIIITLVFWYFNEIYALRQTRKEDRLAIFNLTSVFIIIFVIIMLTLQFMGR